MPFCHQIYTVILLCALIFYRSRHASLERPCHHYKITRRLNIGINNSKVLWPLYKCVLVYELWCTENYNLIPTTWCKPWCYIGSLNCAFWYDTKLSISDFTFDSMYYFLVWCIMQDRAVSVEFHMPFVNFLSSNWLDYERKIILILKAKIKDHTNNHV